MTLKKYHLFILVAAVLAVALLTGAAAATDDSGVGFYVKAVLPENQVNMEETYFDLKMNPGQEQDLKVQLINDGDEDIDLHVRTVSASTNINGVIDYKTPGVRDETLKIPFSEISETTDEPISLPAGTVKEVSIKVTMPEDSFDGVILGGIVVEKIDDEQTLAEEGQAASMLTIKNAYSYVIGVVLRETDAVVTPDFEALSAQPELVAYYPGVSLGIRNREAAVAKNINMKVSVYPNSSGDAIIQTERNDVDMAPNSVMNFALMWDGKIKDGSYVARVEMELNDKTWHFKMPFDVSSSTASQINSEAAQLTEDGEMPLWAWVIIGMLAAVITLVFVLIATTKKRRHTTAREG